MKYLTHDQVKKLLDYHEDPELRLLIRVLYYTGCRISEALAIRPEDIDFERRVLTLPALKVKGRDVKRVVIDQGSCQLLQAYIKSTRARKSKPIFFPGINKDVTRRWLAWKAVKEAGEGIGVPAIHPHTLRHTFAVHWAAGGGDLLRLQRQLGHKKLSTTTDMYIEFATDDIAKDYDKIFREGR